MIARLKTWLRFDAEALAATANALAAFSGVLVPMPIYDPRTDAAAVQESADPVVATTVEG